MGGGAHGCFGGLVAGGKGQPANTPRSSACLADVGIGVRGPGLHWVTAQPCAPRSSPPPPPARRDGRVIGPLAQSSWLRVVPDGLYKITQYATKRYGRPEIWITGGGRGATWEALEGCGRGLQPSRPQPLGNRIGWGTG